MSYSRKPLAVRNSPLGKSLNLTCRSILAMSVLFVCGTVFLIPLAAKVINTKDIAITFADECSGNCSTCGCAPERSASRICCCWQNKLHNRPVEEETSANNGCRHHQIPFPVTGIRTLPCSSGKLTVEWGGKSLVCIVEFSDFAMACFQAETQRHEPRLDYSDWKTEPPDPPPEIIHLS